MLGKPSRWLAGSGASRGGAGRRRRTSSSPWGWGGMSSPSRQASQIRGLPRHLKLILPIKPQPFLQSCGKYCSTCIYFFFKAFSAASIAGRAWEGRRRGGRVYGKKKSKQKKKKERFCSHSENSNSTPAHRQRRLLHTAPRIKCFCFIFNTQSLLVLSCRSSPLPPTCIRSQWHPCQEN